MLWLKTTIFLIFDSVGQESGQTYSSGCPQSLLSAIHLVSQLIWRAQDGVIHMSGASLGVAGRLGSVVTTDWNIYLSVAALALGSQGCWTSQWLRAQSKCSKRQKAESTSLFKAQVYQPPWHCFAIFCLPTRSTELPSPRFPGRGHPPHFPMGGMFCRYL